MIKFIISKEDAGISLNTFLKKNLDAPYEVIKILYDKGKILVNKTSSFKGKLKEGDEILINDNKIKKKAKKLPAPINLHIETIYEDNNFLVFNKPQGIAVQGGGLEKISIQNHLSYLIKKKHLTFCRTSHRLDKMTTGVLIACKSPSVLRDLSYMFKTKEVTKIYLCLVKGVPKKAKATLEYPLLIRNHDKKKVIISKRGRPARTIFRLKKTYRNYSLLEVEIFTGVTHQIRVHLSHINLPIIGDYMYGDKETNSLFFRRYGLKGQFLHCHEISFSYQNRKYCFKAPLPKQFKRILKSL